ncbi:MAG: hypothetical protein K2M12_02875, partial [Muribaculaceae bacterium]|nr:hypothetical protein [Muribaculaceae bacterium]
VRPVVISAGNFDLLLREGRSFEEYFRYLEEQNYVDAQAHLLQPEQIETLQEADEQAATMEEELSAVEEDVEAAEEDKTAEPEPVIKPERPIAPSRDPAPAPVQSTKPVPAPAKPVSPDDGSEGDDPLLE